LRGFNSTIFAYG
jgi:hypothetical protein